MRVSPALMTFLTGLLLLSIAGILYQHSLVESGAYGTGDSTEAAAPAANVKYACPMRCVEADKPGDCPVCGMEMMPVELDTPASLAASTSAEQEYTCPMHPQIEQDHPGTCPICGMELVLKANDSAAVDPAVAESVAAVKISPLQGLQMCRWQCLKSGWSAAAWMQSARWRYRRIASTWLSAGNQAGLITSSWLRPG